MGTPPAQGKEKAMPSVKTEYNRSYRALEALPVPTVAAVRGNVFGGGVELALSCDFIVAARDATIRQIEVSRGSMPMAGGVQRMADRIGRTRAALPRC
jgi:enoyl-CoA hydratase/carnithine racemase